MNDGKGMQDPGSGGPRSSHQSPENGDDPAAGSGEPTLDRGVQGRIGSHLRAMYDEMMQQPIPDRFLDLLANLERGAAAPPPETTDE
ncbi:NepR family anti-sigma factor [Methylobacterium indicum]|uniref:Anti-sigma factor NepR domain-containing protein n=1 Tax=Methylobacterium indicum TaxID=1775910 RepID=A0ABR5GZH4_9HYPH|nr:NepR family anti-sigma factor [Methylobacterium indicum]KMO15853.1 hypothetical protein QR79_23740 [Methylobacterium indicum]KMO16840.1 hypothetical protein QR78_18850 [Methylobacterium indicum]